MLLYQELRGQFRAALLTAALQNKTSGFGCHTGEETDAALAATIRGLKSSFHFLLPSYKIASNDDFISNGGNEKTFTVLYKILQKTQNFKRILLFFRYWKGILSFFISK